MLSKKTTSNTAHVFLYNKHVITGKPVLLFNFFILSHRISYSYLFFLILTVFSSTPHALIFSLITSVLFFFGLSLLQFSRYSYFNNLLMTISSLQSPLNMSKLSQFIIFVIFLATSVTPKLLLTY